MISNLDDMVQNICMFNNLLRYLIATFLMTMWLSSSVFAENIQSSKTSPEESNNLQSVPIKIPESHNYSFADIVEPLIPAVVNVYTVQYS